MGLRVRHLQRARLVPSLPTKTSRLWSHLCGRTVCFLSTSSQVANTRLVNGLSLRILVAAILSLVSLLLIALYHLAWVSFLVSCFPWMTCSRLITHIRWADSEIRIWSSLMAAFFFLSSLRSGTLSLILPGVCRLPHPRIIPRFISGQDCCPCG